MALSIYSLFRFDPSAMLHTLACSSMGVVWVLDAICREVPPPFNLPYKNGIMLGNKVVYSWLKLLRGVICLVQIVSGKIQDNYRVSTIYPMKICK